MTRALATRAAPTPLCRPRRSRRARSAPPETAARRPSNPSVAAALRQRPRSRRHDRDAPAPARAPERRQQRQQARLGAAECRRRRQADQTAGGRASSTAAAARTSASSSRRPAGSVSRAARARAAAPIAARNARVGGQPLQRVGDGPRRRRAAVDHAAGLVEQLGGAAARPKPRTAAPRPHRFGDRDAERLAFQVRLAVDVGQPHQGRHVVALAEQRDAVARVRRRGRGGELASVRALRPRSAGRPAIQIRIGEPAGSSRAAFSSTSCPFQRSNRAAISTTTSSSPAPSARAAAARVPGSSGGRLGDRAMDDAAGHGGKRRARLRERAVEDGEIGADEPRPAIRPGRRGDRLVLPEPDARAAGARPWRRTSRAARRCGRS